MDLTIGQYCHRNSSIHRLDPRAKLLSFVFIIVSVSLASTPWGFLFMALFIIFVILLSHLPPLLVLRNISSLAWLIASIMILHILFAGDGSNPVFSWGPVKITQDGVYSGIRSGCQFLLIVASAIILTLTTVPLRLADGMTEMLRPLGKVGLPVHQFPIMMAVALHFIPVVFAEAERLISTQRARGAQSDGWNIFKKLRDLTPILSSLLRSSFRRADELAIGMESRCYNGETRTHLYDSLAKADSIALAASAVTILLIVALNRLVSAIE